MYVYTLFDSSTLLGTTTILKHKRLRLSYDNYKKNMLAIYNSRNRNANIYSFSK